MRRLYRYIAKYLAEVGHEVAHKYMAIEDQIRKLQAEQKEMEQLLLAAYHDQTDTRFSVAVYASQLIGAHVLNCGESLVVSHRRGSRMVMFGGYHIPCLRGDGSGMYMVKTADLGLVLDRCQPSDAIDFSMNRSGWKATIIRNMKTVHLLEFNGH